MQDYKMTDTSILKEELALLEKRYSEFKARGLKLDMSRGKPGADQLELSNGLFEIAEFKAEDGTDCRNYGGLDGLPEAKRLFAGLLEVGADEIIIGGNSSLNMMYDAISRAMLLGVYGGEKPWAAAGKIKFLCPSPGYDRHFAICEQLGIEMVAVDMREDGPHMDQVEALVRDDASVKGIWCVPKYSNPQGITYSERCVERFAALRPKAKDFRIFWDNAYIAHHLADEPERLKNILAACKRAGNPDMVFIFASTSKITFPGSGLAMLAASENNVKHIRQQLSYQTIGPDKLNQLRHVRFLQSVENIEAHMRKHARLLKPKFDTVLEILERELEGKNIAWWTRPRGGYFIGLDTLDGCAREIVAMAAEAGVIFTRAGATFPYGKDPRDRNIRIAPTYPPRTELEKAVEILAVCVKIVSIKSILSQAD